VSLLARLVDWLDPEPPPPPRMTDAQVYARILPVPCDTGPCPFALTVADVPRRGAAMPLRERRFLGGGESVADRP
jgi:hypothetical protein